MSKDPCIICVAITGSVPKQTDNPAVPITISEQIESTHAAFEAGASIAHCHVRLEDGTPTSDPERFQRLKEGLEAHCPGMIIQFSTGGRSGAGLERGGMLPLGPDMASLTVGSKLVFEDMLPYTMVKNTAFNGIGIPGIAVREASGGRIRQVRRFGYEDYRRRLS